MSTKPVKREAFSATTTAMLDALCATGSMSVGDVLAHGIAATLGSDYDKAITAGKRARRSTSCTVAEYAHSGARALSRTYLFIAQKNNHITLTGRTDSDTAAMTPEFRRAWKRELDASTARRIQEPIATQPFGDITYYAGMSEWEGWAHAPLRSYDVLHVRPYTSIDISTWTQAFPGWTIKESPDGMISIMAPVGAPIKDVVLPWMDEHGIHHEGIREAKNVKRRNLDELPPAFLADLLDTTTPFARGIVKGRHGSSVRRLADDMDDIHSYITIWLLELAQSFDASLGNPFGTWVTKQLPRKVHDLNRTLHGRTASDAEMFYARAVADYQAKYGRSPSISELADELGITVEAVKAQKRHMDGINSVRNAAPLVRADRDDEEETVQIPDTGQSPEDFVEVDERAHQITMAILTATGVGPTEGGGAKLRKPMGFLVTYLLNYDDWVKGDLIHLAGCRDRKVSDEVSSVNKSLARNLSDYSRTRES